MYPSSKPKTRADFKVKKNQKKGKVVAEIGHVSRDRSRANTHRASELRRVLELVSLVLFCFRFFFFFFLCGPCFKSLFWICCNIASVLCFDFLAVRHVGSLLPDQESNPHSPPALKSEVLTTGLPGKALKSLLNLLQCCFYFMFCFFVHEACGIFPDQGSGPNPLHWQADS